MRTAKLSSLLPFLFIGSELMVNDSALSSRPIKANYTNSYGALGWTRYAGTNKSKKKHFNLKKHGKRLKRKHRKSLS